MICDTNNVKEKEWQECLKIVKKRESVEKRKYESNLYANVFYIRHYADRLM